MTNTVIKGVLPGDKPALESALETIAHDLTPLYRRQGEVKYDSSKGTVYLETRTKSKFLFVIPTEETHQQILVSTGGSLFRGYRNEGIQACVLTELAENEHITQTLEKYKTDVNVRKLEIDYRGYIPF